MKKLREAERSHVKIAEMIDYYTLSTAALIDLEDEKLMESYTDSRPRQQLLVEAFYSLTYKVENLYDIEQRNEEREELNRKKL